MGKQQRPHREKFTCIYKWYIGISHTIPIYLGWVSLGVRSKSGGLRS